MSELLKKVIRQIADKNEQIYSLLAKVTAVDETVRTCDVLPLNGDAEIFGVRLQANEGGDAGLVVFPKVDAVVIVTFFGNSAGYLAMCSDIEKVEFGRETLEVVVDESGLHIEKDSQDLKTKIDTLLDLLSNAFEQIATLKVSTAVGIGLVIPSVTTKAQENKAKTGQLKNEFDKIFY